MNLKIFSQNCHGLPTLDLFRRLKLIAEKIKEIDPDVVFLQEIILNRSLKQIAIDGYDIFYSPSTIINKGGLVTLTKKRL
jgi:endonuclease/exonuclease/phosphatase family metal-dependent hydrolase